MSANIFFKKAFLFLESAEKDFSIGLYLKVISSCWFSLEMLIRGILITRFGGAPRKEGALLLRFSDLLKRLNIANWKSIISQLKLIYIMRVQVDHQNLIPDEKQAKDTLVKTRKLFKKLINLFNLDNQFFF